MATPKQARFIGRLLYYKGLTLAEACRNASIRILARPGDATFEECQKLIPYLRSLPQGTMKKGAEPEPADPVGVPSPQHIASTVPPPVGSDLASIIAAHVKPHLDTAQAEITDIMLAELEERFSKMSSSIPITINHHNGKTINVGRQHKQFKLALHAVKLGFPVFLKGPAGSGKTSAMEAIAKALDMPFYVKSMGPQTPESALLGYPDAHGNYVPGFIRQPFEHGGLIGLDEMDNSNPSILTVLNSAIANSYCAFPDPKNPMVAKSAMARWVVSGNTFGTGADAQYVGRQQLDAATLDRFVVIEWGYDESFENDLVTGTLQAMKATRTPDIDKWVNYVRACRNAAASLKIRFVIGPRTILFGVQALADGMEWADVETICLWKSISTDDKAKIVANVGRA